MKNNLKEIALKTMSTGILTATAFGSVFAAEETGAGNVAAREDIKVGAPGVGIDNLGNFISALIRASIIIAALLTFAYLIWGGIQWLTSGGDKSAYEAARGRITAALIGLAIVAAAYAIMLIIGTFFNVDILGDGLNFGNANVAN